MDTHGVEGMCAHASRGYLQLKDGVIQIVFKMLWKKIGKIIERLGRLVKFKPNTCLWAKT
jgi:hypothetical protein